MGVFMADFTFKISPNITLGSYATSRLGEFASKYGNNYMLILDPVLRVVGNSEKIIQSLDDRNINYFIFDEIKENSDSQAINQALDLARKSHIHGVIAAGGGKAISIARAVSKLFNSTCNVYEYLDNGGDKDYSAIPLICLPTTNREPFVFTDKVPIVDSRNLQCKLMKIDSELCKMVIFDPNMTLTLTENQTESMSIESLCLATEAYLSQKASFFSDMFSEKAIEILSYGMKGADSLSITLGKEELLAQGGCMASLACSTSSFGAAYLLALTINSRFQISKSLVTSILFPYVIEDYSEFKTDRVVKVAKNYRVEFSSEATKEEICKAFADEIRQRLAKANLPTRLKDLSISIEQLSLAVEDASRLDYINTLPRSMSSDDLFKLIKMAY